MDLPQLSRHLVPDFVAEAALATVAFAAEDPADRTRREFAYSFDRARNVFSNGKHLEQLGCRMNGVAAAGHLDEAIDEAVRLDGLPTIRRALQEDLRLSRCMRSAARDRLRAAAATGRGAGPD